VRLLAQIEPTESIVAMLSSALVSFVLGAAPDPATTSLVAPASSTTTVTFRLRNSTSMCATTGAVIYDCSPMGTAPGALDAALKRTDECISDLAKIARKAQQMGCSTFMKQNGGGWGYNVMAAKSFCCDPADPVVKSTPQNDPALPFCTHPVAAFCTPNPWHVYEVVPCTPAADDNAALDRYAVSEGAQPGKYTCADVGEADCSGLMVDEGVSNACPTTCKWCGSANGVKGPMTFPPAGSLRARVAYDAAIAKATAK
jgi:hypothetical protein